MFWSCCCSAPIFWMFNFADRATLNVCVSCSAVQLSFYFSCSTCFSCGFLFNTPVSFLFGPSFVRSLPWLSCGTCHRVIFGRRTPGQRWRPNGSFTVTMCVCIAILCRVWSSLRRFCAWFLAPNCCLEWHRMTLGSNLVLGNFFGFSPRVSRNQNDLGRWTIIIRGSWRFN